MAWSTYPPTRLEQSLASELDRLRADNARLREALRDALYVVNHVVSDGEQKHWPQIAAARAILRELGE